VRAVPSGRSTAPPPAGQRCRREGRELPAASLVGGDFLRRPRSKFGSSRSLLLVECAFVVGTLSQDSVAQLDARRLPSGGSQEHVRAQPVADQRGGVLCDVRWELRLEEPVDDGFGYDRVDDAITLVAGTQNANQPRDAAAVVGK